MDDEAMIVEWAVPCLDRDGCRAVFRSKHAAEAKAREEGVSVIEHRTVTPWRPLPDWPPEAPS